MTAMQFDPSEEEDQVRQLSGLPSAVIRARRNMEDEIGSISFGNLAIMAGRRR
jgi:hypothetical protein